MTHNRLFHIICLKYMGLSLVHTGAPENSVLYTLHPGAEDQIFDVEIIGCEDYESYGSLER